MGKLFGRRSGFFRTTLRKAEKVTRKEILPITLPILGAMVAGPIGAAAGGALAGSMRSSHHTGKNMLGGALKGLAIGGGMSMAGGLMQGGAGGGMGGLFGGAGGGGQSLGRAQIFDQLGGMGKGSGGGSGGGIFGGLGNMFGGGGSGGGIFNGLGNMLGGGSGGGGMGGLLGADPLKTLLLGATVLGNLGSKTKTDPRHQENYNRITSASHPHDRVPMPHFKQYQPIENPEYGANEDPNNPEMAYAKPVFLGDHYPPIPQYAKGGYVRGGYIKGDSGGQDDDFDTHIPADSYVMDAASVGALGDGNSANGSKKINEMKEHFEDSGITSYHTWNPGAMVKVKLSPGEEVIGPEIVEKIGGGSIKKGAQKLNQVRRKLRKEKGFTKFLPPKSKPMISYLR